MQQRPHVEQSRKYVPTGSFQRFANPCTHSHLDPQTHHQETTSCFGSHGDVTVSKDLRFLLEYSLQRIAPYRGKAGTGVYRREEGQNVDKNIKAIKEVTPLGRKFPTSQYSQERLRLLRLPSTPHVSSEFSCACAPVGRSQGRRGSRVHSVAAPGAVRTHW